MNHEDACLAVASWMRKQPWCQLAVHELTGSYIGAGPRPPWLDTRGMDRETREQAIAAHDTAVKEWESKGGGQLDVVGVTLKDLPRPRVVIAEVKVSRSDLLADLRARKMLRYERQATECYLAVDSAMLDGGDLLAEARLRGLPVEWGMLAITEGSRQLFVEVVQRAAKLEPPRGVEPTEKYRHGIARRAAVSLSYRFAALCESLRRERPRTGLLAIKGVE